MSTPRLPFAAALIAAATLLAGCSLPNGGAPTPTAAPATVLSAPEVTVSPVDKATAVPLDAAVLVTSAAGNLTSVSVSRAGTNAPVAGQLASNKRSWKATDGLDPAAQYQVAVTATGAGGTHTTAHSTFSTIDATNRLITNAFPGDGSTVGVGQTINLKFNNDIPAAQQPEIVRHLEVLSTPAQAGAWHWFTPREIHYRPEVYWQAGTQVTLNANFHGVNAGNGVWGLGNWSQSFTVGAKHVSMIDDRTHQMQVFENDKLLYTWPVSMGKPGFPTIEGTLLVLYKLHSIVMNSCATFGGAACSAGSANYYNGAVLWDTAVSSNGFYIHAAPWSVGSQGYRDVSHGCINLSLDRAITFWNFSRIGDVVTISNTGNGADFGNGEADWQIPFAQFDNTGVAAPAESTAPAALPGGA